MPTPQPEAHGWHLKREIQVGHLITTLVVAVSALAYINKIEERVAVIESQIASQRERDAHQDAQMAEALTLIRTQLERMDEKLDRLTERQTRR